MLNCLLNNAFILKMRRLPISTLFPYTTLFRSGAKRQIIRDYGLPEQCLRHPCAKNVCGLDHLVRDRKSTRLNSSHMSKSYAVFCLKKKKLTSVDDFIKEHPNGLIAHCYEEEER